MDWRQNPSQQPTTGRYSTSGSTNSTPSVPNSNWTNQNPNSSGWQNNTGFPNNTGNNTSSINSYSSQYAPQTQTNYQNYQNTPVGSSQPQYPNFSSSGGGSHSSVGNNPNAPVGNSTASQIFPQLQALLQMNNQQGKPTNTGLQGSQWNSSFSDQPRSDYQDFPGRGVDSGRPDLSRYTSASLSQQQNNPPVPNNFISDPYSRVPPTGVSSQQQIRGFDSTHQRFPQDPVDYNRGRSSDSRGGTSYFPDNRGGQRGTLASAGGTGYPNVSGGITPPQQFSSSSSTPGSIPFIGDQSSRLLSPGFGSLPQQPPSQQSSYSQQQPQYLAQPTYGQQNPYGLVGTNSGLPSKALQSLQSTAASIQMGRSGNIARNPSAPQGNSFGGRMAPPPSMGQQSRTGIGSVTTSQWDRSGTGRDRDRDRDRDRERDRDRDRERERERERERRERDRERERERERDREKDRKDRERDRGGKKEGRDREKGRESRDNQSQPRNSSKDRDHSSTTSQKKVQPGKDELGRDIKPERKYLVKPSGFSFCEYSRDTVSVSKRYPQLHISPDFMGIVATWIDTIPVRSWSCQSFRVAHIKTKVEPNEQPPTEDQQQQQQQQQQQSTLPKTFVTKSDGSLPITYSVRILIPHIVDPEGNPCGFPSVLNPSLNSDPLVYHQRNIIKFVVTKKGRNELCLIGGNWYRELDGDDPDLDDNILQNTARRVCEAKAGIAPSVSLNLMKFSEIRYHRPQGVNYPEHEEVVVVFITSIDPTSLPREFNGNTEGDGQAVLDIVMQQRQNKKLKSMSISLNGLLDYDESDKMEKTFEASLVGELFHELMQRDCAYYCYDFLLRSPYPTIGKSQKRVPENESLHTNTKKVKTEEDHEHGKQEHHEKKDPDEQKQEHHQHQDHQQPQEGHTQKQEHQQQEHHEKKDHPKTIIEEVQRDSSSNDEKSNHSQVSSPPVNQELLNAFRYFDRGAIGYIKMDDLISIIHSIGLNHSNRRVTELVAKVTDFQTKKISYEEFCFL